MTPLQVVRSVPDDGAERDQWLARHLRGDAPSLARTVNVCSTVHTRPTQTKARPTTGES